MSRASCLALPRSLNSCWSIRRSELPGSGGKRGGVMTSLDESDGDAQGSNAVKPTGSIRESKDFKPRHKANASAKALIQTQRLRSMSKSNLNDQPPTRFPKLSGFCLYVVDHTAFMSLVVLVIFGQSVYMGLEDEGSLVVDVLFTVFYFLELTMRLIAYGSDFFKSAFNLMDLGLIVISFVDLLIVIIRGSSSLDVMVSLRLSRLLRLGGLVRLIRLLRFFKPLYLLVTGIMVSLRTVVWAWLLMSLIIYVFALVFYRALKPDICPGGVAEQDPEQGYFDLMMTYYGSLTLSVFTVFQITTLEDWPQVSDVMSKHHVWLGVMVILLLVLTAYGVMNVTVAIFVNSAMDASSVRSRDIAKKAKEEYEATCKSLYQVFKDADNDGNGTLSKEEFNKAIKEKNLLARLHGAGIDEGSASSLFDILDIDGSGTLDGNEFVEGVLRSRGYAQNKDMVGLRCDIWRANLSVQEEIRQVNVYFEARLLETKQKLENLKEVAGPVLRRAIEEARKKPVKARLSAGPTMTTAEQTTEDHDDSAVAVRPSLKSGFSFEDSH
ncbi:Voltage-dependent T-type calcium channel subunit alpha-1G (Cav3.1c) (NBR13) (Voltage-gated calcium channel subunit alpha Cav3.1) [Durusdinium trenchii]|uniref:Voltage-dependent T-type calcium channel subunit alpha-1G (Cav3.1c) (NBR13) (Voltage-gated calcium channel subunit alpha Cav3.1) n=1 Tax=Durusdinium trenchii TaxID=1381693 RepID=A0ABP0SBP8_9DINO